MAQRDIPTWLGVCREMFVFFEADNVHGLSLFKAEQAYGKGEAAFSAVQCMGR